MLQVFPQIRSDFHPNAPEVFSSFDHCPGSNSFCVSCRAICDLPVSNQEFIENLHELSHKIKVFKEQSFKGATACNDVKDTLDKLKTNVSILGCQY